LAVIVCCLILATLPWLCRAEIDSVAVENLCQRLFQAVLTLKSASPAKSSGRIEELELFWQAEVLAAVGQRYLADQHRQYLKDYFPQSPLLPLLPEFPENISYLTEFNPDPTFSRLVRTAYSQINKRYLTCQDSEFIALVCLLVKQVKAVLNRDPKKGLTDFLELYPESDYAGWAAYQLAWIDWLENQGSTCLLSEFSLKHKSHPLATEAMEAMDVFYHPPQRLALLSSLLPGWGEEILEPGLRVTSNLWYSEILFLAGTIGFAVAAQNNSRLDNLTGAVIFANFLILNHQGSAEKVYIWAQRRNLAEFRKFIRDRLATPVTGAGRFTVPDFHTPTPENMANELVVSMMYQLKNVGSGFVHQDLVQENELTNLGLRAEYLAGILDIERSGSLSLGIAIVPFGRFFLNYAEKISSQNLASGLKVQEVGAGAELAVLTRFELGGPWIQLRLSAGPAWRSRGLSIDNYSYSDQDMIISATFALDWGGMSGTYWQGAVFYENSFHNNEFSMNSQSISVLAESLGFQFGLGVRF